jgi:hypothetical protein
MFSSIQNAEFIIVMKPFEAHFGFFWPLEAKNPKWRITTFSPKILHGV